MEIRNAEKSEIDALAQLWYDGWQDAHAAILPAELKRLRTLEGFAERLEKLLASVRVAGPVGEPLGFASTKTMSYISSTSQPKRAARASQRL